MTAARLKDILYYSAVYPSLPSPLSVLFSFFDVSCPGQGECLGKSWTRSAGLQERPTVEKRVRSDGKARAARERDEGLITTLEEYLRATVCVFHPRPSFLRSSVRCNASFSSFLPSSFTRFPFRVPRLLSSLFTLLHLRLTPIL